MNNQILAAIEQVSKDTGIPNRYSRKYWEYLWNFVRLSLLKKLYKTFFREAPHGSEAQKAAFEKWNELSLQQVESATIVAEARNAYNSAPPDSEVRKAALRKMVELAVAQNQSAPQ